jgi:zinc transport system substrate-binding protein
MWMRRVLLLLLIFPVLALSSAADLPAGREQPEDTHGGRLLAFVSIPPQASFVSAIGGDRVRVEVLVEGGQDPHTYEPSPRRVAALHQADLYFAVGLPFEELILEKASGMGGFTVVRADRGVPRRPLEEHLEDRHQDGPGSGGQEVGREGEPDPHIWLSPPLIEIQARNIHRALAEADPGHREEYRGNLEAFLEELGRVHAGLEELLAPYRGEPFFAFHPAFGYFADAYGLEQVPVEIHGKQPSPRRIEYLINRAREEGVRIIFVSPQFDPSAAQTVADAIGGAVVAIDPLARDVLENLREIGAKIAGSMR